MKYNILSVALIASTLVFAGFDSVYAAPKATARKAAPKPAPRPSPKPAPQPVAPPKAISKTVPKSVEEAKQSLQEAQGVASSAVDRVKSQAGALTAGAGAALVGGALMSNDAANQVNPDDLEETIQLREEEDASQPEGTADPLEQPETSDAPEANQLKEEEDAPPPDAGNEGKVDKKPAESAPLES